MGTFKSRWVRSLLAALAVIFAVNPVLAASSISVTVPTRTGTGPYSVTGKCSAYSDVNGSERSELRCYIMRENYATAPGAKTVSRYGDGSLSTSVSAACVPGARYYTYARLYQNGILSMWKSSNWFTCY